MPSQLSGLISIFHVTFFQCKGFENDFKAEQKEKEKLTAEVKTLLRKLQETTEENKQLKSEMDKIKNYFKAEIDRRQTYNQPQPAPVRLKLPYFCKLCSDASLSL